MRGLDLLRVYIKKFNNCKFKKVISLFPHGYVNWLLSLKIRNMNLLAWANFYNNGTAKDIIELHMQERVTVLGLLKAQRYIIENYKCKCASCSVKTDKCQLTCSIILSSPHY